MNAPFELIQKPLHPNDAAFRASEIIGYTLRYNSTMLFGSWQTGAHPNDGFGVVDPAGHVKPFVAYPRQISSVLQANGLWRLSIATNQLGTNVIEKPRADSLGLKLTPRQFRFRLETYEAAIVPVTDERLRPKYPRSI